MRRSWRPLRGLVAQRLKKQLDQRPACFARSYHPGDLEQRVQEAAFADVIRAVGCRLPVLKEQGRVGQARQELKGYLGSVRVVAEPTRFQLFSERNAAEALIARAANGNMASINGSGGSLRTLAARLPRRRFGRWGRASGA